MYHKIMTILLALLLCAVCLAEAPGETAAPTVEPTAEPSAEASVEPGATPQPAKAYVLVQTATQIGFLPVPDEGEYAYHLEQVTPDGTPAENVIHVTSEGVYMEDSTCENHDCVDQGEVTLQNRKDRILGNMIICLPNQVTLQLLTPDEVLEMFGKQE